MPLFDDHTLSQDGKSGASSPAHPFDLSGNTVKRVLVAQNEDDVNAWWIRLSTEAQVRKAIASQRKSLSPAEIEQLARTVFAEYQPLALDAGVPLPDEFLTRLIGELSGLGPLLALIARPDVEDLALNLGHLYIYTTASGWEHAGAAPEGIGDALRVLMDRAGQRTPTPDAPIADAMLQVMVPTPEGVQRKGVRVNYLMPPASPYGDSITLRISNYRTQDDLQTGSLATLCRNRLPPVSRPVFSPVNFPRGDGLLTAEAANYVLSVMVHGGTLVISGTTGSGKTFVAQRILQEMLAHFPRGAIRLFIVENSDEIVLNGWDGDPQTDTGNVIYTVTRPGAQGGPPPVTMYALIRAALRSRPHGIIIGEARGAEAWELVRAAATGHGHSAFTIHATGAEHVWPRFLQVVQAHPDAQRLDEYQIAQGFAEAVTAVMHLERSPQYGQIVREIAEISPVVERRRVPACFSPSISFPAGQRIPSPLATVPNGQGFGRGS